MANLTLYNIAIIVVICLGGFTYGFGFAVFTSSIGQPGFYAYFDLELTSSYAAAILGAVNALFAFGAACGAIAQGWLADWRGRKTGFVIAAVFSIAGGALTAGSVHIAMLITARLLQGFGLGMIICLVPLYITEVAPARVRGMLSGLTVLSFGIGYVICPFISVGTLHASNQALQWRLPLAFACVGPLALLIGLPFIPESPRYLAWVGKNAEAWAIIERIHGEPEDSSNSFAHAEFTQIVRQVEFDKGTKAGYIQMFIQPSWRRRSLLVMFLTFASQSTGILGISNFMVVICTTLGLEGNLPFIIIGVYSLVGTFAVAIVLGIVDRVGRRTMLLLGYPIIAVLLLAETLLQWRYVGTTDKAGNAAALLIIFIYIVCYQLVDAPSFIWAAEVFPTTIRAKGLGLTFFAYFAGAITYTTPAAIAFQNIKWGMYLIWMGCCITSTFIVYFFIPETARLPMEEIGALFGDKVVVHLTSDSRGIEEDKLEVTAIHDEGRVNGKTAGTGEHGCFTVENV